MGRNMLTPTNYHWSTERKQFLQVKADLHSVNVSRMTGVTRWQKAFFNLYLDLV